MREIAREIKGFTSESHVSIKAEEEAGPDFKERLGRPEILVKSVVATSGDVDAFGRFWPTQPMNVVFTRPRGKLS